MLNLARLDAGVDEPLLFHVGEDDTKNAIGRIAGAGVGINLSPKRFVSTRCSAPLRI